MSLTESINSFDTKLNQITTDIYKEVEKITGNPLEAEQKKLSNLIPFLRDVYSTIAALKQSKKELETTVKKFQERGDELCKATTERTGRKFSPIVKPNDLNSLYVYIVNGDFTHDWANKNLDIVWSNAIYPNLQNAGKWRTKLNEKYVMKCSISFSNGEQRTMLEAAERPVDSEQYLNYVNTKEIMLVE